ncbi:hypothetical protein [Kibdelosporangium philippinense]|uniref:hypothetical protein n=1 Tax=Kibdelosporangium philippinense TaxID=211113 RepID=UPI00360FE782
MVYRGVLPELPAVGMTGADLTTLNNELNAAGPVIRLRALEMTLTGQERGSAGRAARGNR